MGLFCQEVSVERRIFLPSLVSLFDLKARFFIPTRHSGKPSRHLSEIALLAVLALAVAPLALIAAINPRFSVAPITAIIVLLVPTITHASPIASALDRVLEVVLGGVTGLVVSFLLLPSSFDHEVDMGGVVIVERTRSAPVIST